VTVSLSVQRYLELDLERKVRLKRQIADRIEIEKRMSEEACEVEWGLGELNKKIENGIARMRAAGEPESDPYHGREDFD
jgi:hypothetical protein